MSEFRNDLFYYALKKGALRLTPQREKNGTVYNKAS